MLRDTVGDHCGPGGGERIGGSGNGNGFPTSDQSLGGDDVF
jgi:hypothetical protein